MSSNLSFICLFSRHDLHTLHRQTNYMNLGLPTRSYMVDGRPGCNRTYYGNVGLTYDLELHRPKEDKIPYTCILTFSAAGGQHGDIVQVSVALGISSLYRDDLQEHRLCEMKLYKFSPAETTRSCVES